MEFAINSNLPHFSFERKFTGKVPTIDVSVVLKNIFSFNFICSKVCNSSSILFYMTYLTTSKTPLNSSFRIVELKVFKYLQVVTKVVSIKI